MIYTIENIKGVFIVKHFDQVISKKKTLLQATKALAAYQKGRE